METSTPYFNHFTASIWLSELPDGIEFVDTIARSIVDKLGLNIVKAVYHEFQPQGITFLYILSQSHFAIHTWPEHNFIHIDLVSCRQMEKEEFEETVQLVLTKNSIIQLQTSEIV